MYPKAQGLYDPNFEHDACGVGMVCNVQGQANSDIVSMGLQVLENLEHRGATGCDPDTGDGAGIMTAIPRKFFLKRVSEGIGRDLDASRMAIGMLFMPRNIERFKTVKNLVNKIVKEAGFEGVMWRPVPTDESVLGSVAKMSMPRIWQLIVLATTTHEIEQSVFRLRREIEFATVNGLKVSESEFYICSFSARTIVYKGMLKVDQLRSFYPDLSNPDFESAFAIVHSRFSTNTFPSWSKAQPFRNLCHNGEINTLQGNLNRMRSREALFQDSRDRTRIGSVLI